MNECTKPESEIITGSLILYEESESDNEENDSSGPTGQSVQCAQS